MNRTGCLPKGVAHGGQMGHQLLLLAQKAHSEGKIGDEDWKKLPRTPEGMINLLLGEDVEKRLIEALLASYE